MYWKGKSQASGQTGYFPSENVKMYSQTRADSIGSAIMPSPTLRQQCNGQMLYNFPWYVGEMDRNGGRSVKNLLIIFVLFDYRL